MHRVCRHRENGPFEPRCWHLPTLLHRDRGFGSTSDRVLRLDGSLECICRFGCGGIVLHGNIEVRSCLPDDGFGRGRQRWLELRRLGLGRFFWGRYWGLRSSFRLIVRVLVSGLTRRVLRWVSDDLRLGQLVRLTGEGSGPYRRGIHQWRRDIAFRCLREEGWTDGRFSRARTFAWWLRDEIPKNLPFTGCFDIAVIISLTEGSGQEVFMTTAGSTYLKTVCRRFDRNWVINSFACIRFPFRTGSRALC